MWSPPPPPRGFLLAVGSEKFPLFFRWPFFPLLPRLCSAALARRASSSSAMASRRTTCPRPQPPGKRAARACSHFTEVNLAERYAPEFGETVESEEFAKSISLERSILAATVDNAVAQLMTELKSAIEEQHYQDASRLTKFAGTSCWWVGGWIRQRH